MKKELYEESLKDVKLIQSFVRTKSAELPAGYAVVRDGSRVLSIVSNKFKLISNMDLLAKINADSKLKIAEVYGNGLDTFHYIGYFPDKNFNAIGTSSFLGVAISNSYSNRFLPAVKYIIYDYLSKEIIFTPLDAYELKRSSWLAAELIDHFDNLKKFITLAKSYTLPSGIVRNNIQNMLPERYKITLQNILEDYKGKLFLSYYDYLIVSSKIANRWINTNFIHTQKFSEAIYINIINSLGG